MNSAKIAIVAASPRPAGKAASDYLAGVAAEMLRPAAASVNVINARQALSQQTTDEAFQIMADADAILVVFPLYVFCLPGITMRFLQNYHSYLGTRDTRKRPAVYAVINCGFPEPDINAEASRVVRRFADAIGGRYGFGILIGSGGMAAMSVKPAQTMMAAYRKAVARIAEDSNSETPAARADVQLRVNFPRRLYFFMADLGWRRQIRKNGGRLKDLYRRPYQPEVESRSAR